MDLMMNSKRWLLIIASTIVFALLGLIGSALAHADSLEVSHGSNPIQDVSLSIKISGVTSGNNQLFVFVDEGTVACPMEPDANSGVGLMGEEAISPGPFIKEYSYTPEKIGSYTVCAYLSSEGFSVASVIGSTSFVTVMPTASIGVSLSTASSANTPVDVTLTGTTQVARKLLLFINEGTRPCPNDPEGNGPLLSTLSLLPGSFNTSFSFTPNESTAYTVCAYIDEDESYAPNAIGTASFSNITPARRQAEAERAAEAKAVLEASIRPVEPKPDKKAKPQPITRLSVQPVAHYGRSKSHPGYTSLIVSTTPFARVTLELTHNGHTTLQHLKWANKPTQVVMIIRWSCKNPGISYHYAITAQGNTGESQTKTGGFTTLSSHQCYKAPA
jgi:hypothetical protein